MKLAGNQPYFLPYIGYWQLVNAVDVFLIADDYAYIERGWINRNRYLINGEAKFFNISVNHASSNKNISELTINHQLDTKLRNQIENAYHKAPYYREGMALLDRILSCEETCLSEFLFNATREVCRYLGITTELRRTSEFGHPRNMNRDERIFDFCQKTGADTCYNAIGGMKLYTFEEFRVRGLKLGFIQSQIPEYRQFDKPFVPGLSILDVIMFNSVEQIRDMLEQYTLITEDTEL